MKIKSHWWSNSFELSKKKKVPVPDFLHFESQHCHLIVKNVKNITLIFAIYMAVIIRHLGLVRTKRSNSDEIT